jgi:hypothetical protein
MANETLGAGRRRKHRSGWRADKLFDGLPAQRFIDLYQPNRESDFYEIHPPPTTHDEFAKLLAEALHARGLISIASRASSVGPT